MEIIIKLDRDFNADEATHATVLVYRGNDKLESELLGTVAVKFTEGADSDQHVIEIVLPGMPHYQQAKIVYEACLMIDSHFEDCETPYTGKLIES